MSPNDLYEYCHRNKAEIGRMLGCGSASVAEWFNKNQVPEGKQYQAQLATGGKLMADLPADRRTMVDTAESHA